jgi:hypothetical protein
MLQSEINYARASIHHAASMEGRGQHFTKPVNTVDSRWPVQQVARFEQTNNNNTSSLEAAKARHCARPSNLKCEDPKHFFFPDKTFAKENNFAQIVTVANSAAYATASCKIKANM